MHDYPIARSPLRVGAVELPNRIARGPHATGYVRNGISEDLIAYHEARAAGGVGLLFLELAAVHKSSVTTGYELINAMTDDVIGQYARLVERVHPHGAKVFQQLWHGGAYAFSDDGSPSWSASEVPGIRYGPPPIAMTKVMIDDLVTAFAAAARRCTLGGIDGIEIQFGHGYLLGQFLSPATNRRTDDYGGSMENRLRLGTEILAAVRAEVGPGYPVGVRMSANDLTLGGPCEPDVREMALALERAGLVDFVDVSLGTHRAPGKLIAPMSEPHGFALRHEEQVTRALSVPTMVTGRIVTLAEAEDVLASGAADLVSMVRATIADPDLVNKSFAGRAAQVRPCIGCNQGCIAGLLTLSRMGCAVNFEAGREASVKPIDTTDAPRTVLVVGAGPAGLEAARVAAVRGHRVILREAADAPGGMTRLARLVPGRAEIGNIGDWLAAECERLKVDMEFGSPADAETVAKMEPDTVIVATGSTFHRDGLQRWRPALEIPGIDLPHVVTPVDVLTGRVNATSALIVDDLGAHPAIDTAEYLLAQGISVTFAGSPATIAPDLIPTQEQETAVGRLLRGGATLLTRMALEAVGQKRATLRHLDSGEARHIDCDLVVLVTGFHPQRSLYNELTRVHPDVRIVGDANNPLGLQSAIAAGNAIARAI